MAKKEVSPTSDAIELAILGEGDGAIPLEDPEAVAREIVYRILGAEDVKQLFEQEGTTSARDILGVPLDVRGVRWQTSRMEGEGPKVYALINANRMDTGEQILITCGGRNVMAQLFRASQLQQLPLPSPVKFQENETSSGYGSLWLVSA